MTASERRDVVIVGGGIAGSSAAYALAHAGLDVLVLERETRYEDRVRGEGMTPWGALEAQQLGVDRVLVGAGGAYVTKIASFDELWDPAGVVPFDLERSGVSGFLHVGHPEACAGLAAAAREAGATLTTGVEVRAIQPGAIPVITYKEQDGTAREVTARLVIGADGRASFVRRHLGFRLNESDALTFGGGLVVENSSWADDVLALGTEGERHYIITPRPGATRLYLFMTPADAKGTFRGGSKASAFLALYHLTSLPDPCAFDDARPIGPCGFFPMTDSWVDDPTVPGVVLVGDAAGWNNPIIGQGLGIAMRDVRQVVDVVASGAALENGCFDGYVQERRERMRRLRVTAFVDTCVSSWFCDAGRALRARWEELVATDATAAAHRIGKAIGVDTFPREAYTEATVRAIVGDDHPYLTSLASHGLAV